MHGVDGNDASHGFGHVGGRDRLVLQGILFVLITGIDWEDLPQELGSGSGMTCWRRLRRRQAAGVFDALHQMLLAECHAARLVN